MTGALAVAERVARTVFRNELHGRPIYLIQPERGTLLTPEMLRGAGLYCRGLDRLLKPMLEAKGEWRGNGVAAIVDAFQLFALASDDDDALRSTIGTTLHELCHFVDMPDRVEVGPDDYPKFAAACEAAKAPPAETPEWPPNFIFHSHSFTRIACHAWWRCRRFGGVVLDPRYLHFGSDYGGLEWLPSPAEFIDALGDELETFEECSLRIIAAGPEPEAYAALWNRVFETKFLPAQGAA